MRDGAFTVGLIAVNVLLDACVRVHAGTEDDVLVKVVTHYE